MGLASNLIKHMKEDQRYRKTYHVVFSTYKRRPIFLFPEYYNEVKIILKEIYQCKNIKVYIDNLLQNHIHILLEKPQGINLSWIIKLIKGGSTYYFFQKFPELKENIGRGRLWAKGYWWEEIKSRKQFLNTIKYIKNNKDKHKRG